MDPVASSLLASDSTETAPVQPLAAHQAPKPRAAAKEADTTIEDDPLAKPTPEQQNDSVNEKTADYHNAEGPGRSTSLLNSFSTRSKIREEISKKTGDEVSSRAIDIFLELALATDLILNTLAYEEPPPSATAGEGSREVAVPEIRLMSWEEWMRTALREGTRKGHSAIDILYEEPQPQRTSGRRSLLGIPRSSTAAIPEGRSSLPSKEDGPTPAPKALPSRLRINSVPAKRLLDSLCNDELEFSSETDTLVMMRPYKVLTIHEGQIKDKMADIECLYNERLQKAGSAKTSLSQSLEPMAAACEQQSERIHGTDAKDFDTEENTEIQPKDNKSKQEAESLAQRKFPQDMIFLTGTDWSELTLSEVKEAVDDFRCLVRFISEYLQPVWTYFNSEPTSINFSNIWHLFPIGSLAYAMDRSTPQKIWKVVQATGGRKYLSTPNEDILDWEGKFSPFIVDCYYLDHDGANFIRVYRQFQIEMFENSMSIAGLPIIPLAVAEDIGHVASRKYLRERGKQFLGYMKPQHRYYQGTTITQTPGGEPLYRRDKEDFESHRLFTERVESQVVIDFERGIQANPEWGPATTEPQWWKSDVAELFDGIERAARDNVWDARVSEDFLKAEELKRQRWNKGEATPDGDDLLLLPDRVFGYVLRTRSWACLRLSADDSGRKHLTHVDQRSDPWQDLEIPTGHKNIVQALINTHFSEDKSRNAEFDLVREKGKGVIVLLHGVPGVGKTATAECVAASYGKPLLPITCGDLGLKPREVETTLETAFQLAQAWDCVMLLDEADIFLAQRTNQDIERNALVSVFLRILEYYEGILFLTTNRIGVFDEAFKSRIHMALYYPPLNWPTTEKIWRNLMRRACESPMELECNPDSLIAFARQLYGEQNQNINSIGPAWNGRQIRNAFQSAIALARSESASTDAKVMVEPRHFKTVAEVSNEFNQYIWKVKSGRTDADIAKEVQSRYDKFSPDTFAEGAPQSQSHYFQPPSQTPMPMRPAMPNTSPFQSFPSQFVHQQPVYTTATGSPYNSTPPASYSNGQQPPHFNISSAHGPQQAQYAQHLPGGLYQASVASVGQQFQTSQPPPVQQFHSSQPVAGQQFQAAQPQSVYGSPYQPGVHSSYSTAGAADQTLSLQEVPPDRPRA